MIEKKNEQLSFRVPDELKERFHRLCEAEGKHSSTVLVGLVEAYIIEREQYVASIASMFGYRKD